MGSTVPNGSLACRDEVGDVEEVRVALQHRLEELPLQLRDLPLRRMLPRPFHRVKRPHRAPRGSDQHDSQQQTAPDMPSPVHCVDLSVGAARPTDLTLLVCGRQVVSLDQ